jgi:ribulose-phosphate 3-epimerase
MSAKISASVLDSNFTEIKITLRMLEDSKIEYIHFDVMDGNFVPNLTFGARLIKPLRPLTKLVFDTHLMIKNPEKYLADFLDAGSDIVTVHAEATKKIKEIIGTIHARGKKAGLSIKPGTPLSSIMKWLPSLDLVLVMSVEPGFGGQKFMEKMLEKVRKLRAVIDEKKYSCLIEIDGGINAETLPNACAAGIDLFVAGRAIFGEKDPRVAIRNLMQAVNNCKK